MGKEMSHQGDTTLVVWQRTDKKQIDVHYGSGRLDVSERCTKQTERNVI